MPNELLPGLGFFDVAVGAAHLGALICLQYGLNRLIRLWRVDRLSLVANKGVRAAILRATLTRLQAWLWLCGLYTLFAWHLKPVVVPWLGHTWGTVPRDPDVLMAFTVLALS